MRDPTAGTALKAFGGWELYGSWDSASGEGLPGVAAAVQPDGARLELAWYAPIAPNLGIWVDDGGWPEPPSAPRAQHALEPTTSPDDDLASAMAAGRALVLAPEERVAWSATFRVRAPGEARGRVGGSGARPGPGGAIQPGPAQHGITNGDQRPQPGPGRPARI